MLFPWERYHDGQDGLPFTIDTWDPSKLKAQSKCCVAFTPHEGTPCHNCADVHGHITRLIKIVQDPKPNTNYRFLGLGHLQDLLKALTEQVKHLKLQIVNIALRNGASICEIINKLEDALEGAYNPRGYGAEDLDIATLVFRLGGHKLLFALNHKLGLPSLRTLRAKSTFTSIMPTIGPIQDEQFHQNIDSIVHQEISCGDSSPRRGVSLMIDEIALEEMAVHFSKYNKVGGLCWKHSHIVDPVLHTYNSAANITQKIHDGDIHLGKELTVIGASCFGEDEIYPLLAAPTCKTEDATDMENILARTIRCWSASSAAASIGPIWSFATDGDATQHTAGHKLFLRAPLSEDSPLYGSLINLAGLNLFTGDGEVMLDVDFKHIFKPGIVLNNGRVINSMVLLHYLVWLPAYNKEAVVKLLYPDDPQDVPRAIELMQAIVEFCKHQHHAINDSCSTDIDTRADLNYITLLGALIESILSPFIDVSMSLSDQMKSLSCYSHLAFAFFHAHRRSFVSYQLYYDVQTTVKNAFFCLSKPQCLDPHAHFFLGDIGDDPLETLFGRTHMIGGHNSAFSYAQALDRIGAAKDINSVFKRRPELDPGHRRLKLTRQEGADHINCELWKGDIIAGRCDLPFCWHSGRESALAILSKSQLDPIHYSFADLFSSGEIDMLRPFGENKYLGVNADNNIEDTSRVPIPPPHPTPTISPCSQYLETSLDMDAHIPASGEIQVEGHEDDELMLTFEEQLIDESPVNSPLAATHSHVIQDPSAPALPEGPGIQPDDYLLFKGRWIHKQTVCRLIINKDFVSKSLNCLKRVRSGYTKVHRRVDMLAGRITNQNLFLVGDIFLTLLRSGRSLSIGVLCSTTLSVNNVSHPSINVTVMKSSRSTIKITGQLLTIIPAQASPDTTILFLWNGGYVTSRSAIQDDFSQVSGGQSTWQIAQDTLQAACDLLWAKATDMNVSLNSIAVVVPSDPKVFPYQFADGTLAVVSVEATNQLAASGGERITTCLLCEAKVSGMRPHMGLHILRALYHIPEANMKDSVGTILPCGFCGRSGRPECALKVKVTTSGPLSWETKYAGSANTPSRNVPVNCYLCHPTLVPELGKSKRRVHNSYVEGIWRYNMVEHILAEHEEYAVPGHREIGSALLEGVWLTMKLEELEQKAALGIPQEHFQVSPPPAMVTMHDKENQPVASGSRKLKRSGTQTGTSRPSKKARTASSKLQLTRAHLLLPRVNTRTLFALRFCTPLGAKRVHASEHEEARAVSKNICALDWQMNGHKQPAQALTPETRYSVAAA
ncbi:hypothetical protein BDR03DRAFT_986894 [Suillus americanus]|nr:hypothetical protein BDR03DRAFT_986894 [Suillus americanus]